MNDRGIAWMIAGGARNESLEDQRMRMHRIALAESALSVADGAPSLRQRFAGAIRRRALETTNTAALTTDCCPA